MGKLVKLDKRYGFGVNFWELNPQVSMIEPFASLYDTDEGGKKSSDYMWACWMYCDPDEKENIMYRYRPKERRKHISKRLDIDWNDPIFQECIDAYPREMLNSIERSLKDQTDAFAKRSKELHDTPYTLDHYLEDDMGNMVYDKSGKPILVKGTHKQLDDAWAKTDKIYSNLEKAYKMFVQEKEEESRVYGGRQRTASEKGLV